LIFIFYINLYPFFYYIKSEKNSVKIYFDLLDKSNDDYKISHSLSYLLIKKIREFGWVDIDFTTETEIRNVLQKVSNVSIN
jgi:hypothetical protein